MHNHQPLATCLTVWLCALLAAAASAHADDWVPAERRLPPNVEYFRSFRNVPEFQKAAAGTAENRFYADPRLNELLASSNQGLTTYAAHIESTKKLHAKIAEEHVGIRVDIILEAIVGEASVAVVRGPKDDANLIWFFDLGNKAQSFADDRTWLASWVTEDSDRISQSTIQGTNCATIEIPTENRNWDLERFAFFARDSYLVMASSTAMLSAVLERWNGNHPATLAHDPTFQQTMKQADVDPGSPRHHYLWYERRTEERIFFPEFSGPGEMILRHIEISGPPVYIDTDIEVRGCERILTSDRNRHQSRAMAIGGKIEFSVAGCDTLRKCAATKVSEALPSAASGLNHAQKDSRATDLADSRVDADEDLVPPEKKFVATRSGVKPPKCLPDTARQVHRFHWNLLPGPLLYTWPEEYLDSFGPSRHSVLPLLNLLGTEPEATRFRTTLTGNTWLIESALKSRRDKRPGVFVFEILDEKGLRDLLNDLSRADRVSTWSAVRHHESDPDRWDILEEEGILWWRKWEPQSSLLIAEGHLFLGDAGDEVIRVALPQKERHPLSDHADFHEIASRLPQSYLALNFARAPTRDETILEEADMIVEEYKRSKAGLPRDSVPALTKDYFGAEATWLERDGDFVRRTYIRLPPR